MTFLPPDAARKRGRYDVDRDDIESRAFIAVSTFATVWRTIKLFEEKHTLGRESRGASVHRDCSWSRAPGGWRTPTTNGTRTASSSSRSRSSGKTVHTSLSRDIVAHETGRGDPSTASIRTSTTRSPAVARAPRRHRRSDRDAASPSDSGPLRGHPERDPRQDRRSRMRSAPSASNSATRSPTAPSPATCATCAMTRSFGRP